MLLLIVPIKSITFGWKLNLVYNSTLLWTENKLPELLTIDASHQISNLSLVIPLFYLCIWFPVWYLFDFILQMGYSFLCFIEFERSANVPSMGERWLVLGIHRLNYRKTLIAAWWNYSWVFDIRQSTKLSIFPLFRRMSAMLDFPPYWNFRHVGFSHIGIGHHLCCDHS